MRIKNKIIEYSIWALFIMLPIIDCCRRTFIKDISIFGISILEIFNIIIIGYTLILTLIKLKNKKKKIIPLVIYTIILFIYLYLHNLNILKFDQTLFNNSNINVFIESYYILRVYYMPVLLLFILINNKEIFNLKFYSKVIKSLIYIICLSIILLNIFKLSYATYSPDNNEFVKYNIFDFYKSNESFKMLSTRGWFDSSNEISAILMMLFPINIYLLYKENKKNNIFLYIIQFLAMIILGTRVSSLGAILIAVTSILINLFSKIMKQSNLNKKFIITSIFCCIYFFLSPVGNYFFNQESFNYNITDEYSENLKQLDDSEQIVEYINDNLYHFRINEEFIKMYPVENDVEFWYDIALRNRNLNNDSRVMKTTIINRIYERNNNKYDKYLGMGYTTNFMDLERDYIYQFYIFGIFGIILILPQIIIVIKSLIKILLNFKNILNKLLIIMSSILGFSVAYFSGHVFGWVTPSYILILVIALLNYYILIKKEVK